MKKNLQYNLEYCLLDFIIQRYIMNEFWLHTWAPLVQAVYDTSGAILSE